MEILKNLAQKYKFDYGFTSEFNEEIIADKSKLSKVASLSTSPREILKSCNTVIVLAFAHNASDSNSNIAGFASGVDYHNKLKSVGNQLVELFDDAVFLVDTHQLNERYFAQKSGIGYCGKNSMFISDKYGSYCHLALILTSEKLSNKRESKKACGSCSRCISACPVGAIEDQIDCNKCISERLQKRDNLDFKDIGTNIYGCDICQSVCPHNTDVEKEIANIDCENELEMTKKEFEKYKDKTFYWIGYRSYIRNVHVSYIRATKDYSKLCFLEKSNSDYLQEVARKLKGENTND